MNTHRQGHLLAGEEQLHRSQETFKMMVSAVKDYAIYLLDAQGFVTTWNTGAQRMKGYKETEIIGKHFSTFYTQADKDRSHPEKELQIAVENGRYEEEGWRVRKDGSEFWASVTITSIKDMTDTLIGFVKVTRDLTERKKAEKNLKMALEKALESDRLKSQFVANISHEIRTPLAGLIGMAEQLVEDETLNAEQREISNYIFSSAQRLVDVLNGILDFSKLEAGRVVIDEIEFSLRKTVQKVKGSILPLAQAKNLNITTSIDPKIPDTLFGDESKLHQILLNIAHNAVKFTLEGKIAFSVDLIETNGSAIVLRFDIIDTGIGINDETQTRLFKPFMQADGSTRRKFGGTGLGLSIAKQYVALLGGSIGVTSKPGQGSTFWFTMPLKMVD